MQTDKRMKYEGDPYSKWVQATRVFGRNETSTTRLGTIISPPPEIKMLLDNDPIEYDKQDIYVTQKLTAHQRIADTFSEIITMPMSAEDHLSHTHQIQSIRQTDTVIDFTDELKVGDRVLVECDNENMKYIILDRVVSYK